MDDLDFFGKSVLPDPSSLGVPHIEWRPNQKSALENVLDLVNDRNNNTSAFLELPTGCVSKDTVISLNRAGNGRKFTIEAAYVRSISTWRVDVKSKIRAHIASTGLIGLNDVLEFIYSGEKETYILTLDNGYSVRATPEHLIMTNRGYIKLIDLCVGGDKVLCDTMTVSNNYSKPRYKLVSGLVFHPYRDRVVSDHFKDGISNRVPYHRLVAEANLSSVSVDNFIDRCRVGNIDGLVFLDPKKYPVHHIDENVSHNELDNLKVMTNAEHKKVHGDNKNFGYPTYAKVNTIFKYGVEAVYDVVCREPNTNFVANGIVVHNSGKSAIPTALSGMGKKVVVYVHSLSLLDQYKENYGFDIVKGMANYRCVYQPFIDSFQGKRGYPPSVPDCIFEPMDGCPVYSQCPYIVARTAAYASNRMACTYQFAILSPNVLKRTGVAVWDEAHFASDTIVRMIEVKVDDYMRRDWGLPAFPYFGYHDGITRQIHDGILDWINKSIAILSRDKPHDLFMDELSTWRNALRKLQNIQDMVETTNDFYFESAIEQRKTQVGRMNLSREIPYIMIKPFSAAKFAKRISSYKSNILMSGTLGKPDPLAQELGMKSYLFWEYPHPVPPNLRPVYDLGVSRMVWSDLQKYPNLFKLQAIRISTFIKELPSTWRGIIVTPSYEKARILSEFLDEMLPGRIFKFQTGDHVKEFIENTTPGKIVVDVIQVWGYGLDLKDDIARFSIVAGVPFGSQSDPFEQSRKKHGNPDYSWWMNYISVPQAIGRVSRGELRDGNYLLNVGALADGSATTGAAMRFYPRWFREAIVQWQPQ